MTINVEEIDKILKQIEILQKAFSAGILTVEELDGLTAPLKAEIKKLLIPIPVKPAEPTAVPSEAAEGVPPAGPGSTAEGVPPTTPPVEGLGAGTESGTATPTQ